MVAAELALLIHLSFQFRSRIGVKAWRRLHFATYAVFAGGAVHGIAAGTDTGSTSARMLYAASVGAVAALTGWRAVTARRAPARNGPRPVRLGPWTSPAPAGARGVAA